MEWSLPYKHPQRKVKSKQQNLCHFNHNMTPAFYYPTPSPAVISWRLMRSDRDRLGALTWTICRGCTDSVGKFPRPWIGTLSPRMESKRCTWSHDSTLTRRLWSQASAEDMATGGGGWMSAEREGKSSAAQRKPPLRQWCFGFDSGVEVDTDCASSCLRGWLNFRKKAPSWWECVEEYRTSPE